MSEREFKSATEAVEFYREQVRTQNGYAMQQRLRAEEAETERDRLEAELSEAHQAEAHACQQRDRLREDLLTLLRLLLVEDCAFVEGGAAQLENAAWPILDRMGGYEILERTSE